ncbi:unnamed protein product [Gadus morhua 'NCC']
MNVPGCWCENSVHHTLNTHVQRRVEILELLAQWDWLEPDHNHNRWTAGYLWHLFCPEWRGVLPCWRGDVLAKGCMSPHQKGLRGENKNKFLSMKGKHDHRAAGRPSPNTTPNPTPNPSPNPSPNTTPNTTPTAASTTDFISHA